MTRSKLLAKVTGGEGKPVYVRWQDDPEEGIYSTGCPVGGTLALMAACPRDAAIDSIRLAFSDREIVLY